MKEVFINARFLTQPVTGVQRFAIETSRELLRLDGNIRFIAPKKLLHRDIAGELGVISDGRGTGHYWEQLQLPKLLKLHGTPFLVNLCNTAPLKYERNAIVLHDLAFRSYPEWFSAPFAKWYNWLIPKIVEDAELIFTVSEFSKSEIEKAWPRAAGKLKVVGNGLGRIFSNKIPRPEIKREKIILAFSGNNRRKNPENVLRAFRILNDAEARLWMFGRESNNFSRVTLQEGLGEGVEFKTDISDEALVEAYRKAVVLVYPSQYEGFGLPPLEALSCGCPSVLTDIPVFRENYSGCAHFIEDDSAESIERGIRRVLDDSQYATSLVQKGGDLIERFTFKQVAEKILEALK